MQVTPLMLLTVCPLIFLASFVDSIAGGGGLISLPAYLLTGMSPQLASGSNKFSATCGTIFATGRYFKSGKLPLLPALLACPGALLGSSLGAWLLQQVSEQFARTFMLVALPVVAVLLLIRRDIAREARPFDAKRAAGCALIGLVCGLYDGFFGPGTGTILIMLFTWFVGLDMVNASGAAKLVNLASNLAAMVMFWKNGYILFPLALPAAACSIVGGYLGAKMAIQRGAKLIRVVMMLVLFALIAKLLWDLFLGNRL